MPDYLKAIRDCCRDEAAFERLKQILVLMGKDEVVPRQTHSCDPTLSSNSLCLQDVIHQSPQVKSLESDSPKAIARICSDREGIYGNRSIEINALVNPNDKLKMQQLLQEKGSFQNLKYELHNQSGEVLIGQISGEITNLNSQQCKLSLTTNIRECERTEASDIDSEDVCANSQVFPKAFCTSRLLAEMALRIRKSLNLAQILNSTVEEVRQFLQADRVFIGCLDDHNQGEILAESVDNNWPSMMGWKLNENYILEIKSFYQHGNVRAIEDTSQVEKTPFLTEYYTRYQVRSGLGVAIIVDEQLFGVLVANQCSGPRQWQPFEIDLLEKLAVQVAIAIQQAQLYEQVQTLNRNLEHLVAERTAQLQQRNLELQELNRIKDVLLHTVSHDLRTSVMGALMLFKNWLNQAGETIPIPRCILERIVKGSDRQLNMINSLLETHACEEQGAIVHRELVQFNSLVNSIIQDLEPLLSENKAALSNLVPTNLPLVIADPTQMERVFESLFLNILKHNPPGLQITLSANVEAGMLRCRIQDNGAGMSQVECDRIFDLYVRDPQAKCSNGIGLKLYLARQIIKATGGEIGVISKIGEGSTYWFTLPVK